MVQSFSECVSHVAHESVVASLVPSRSATWAQSLQLRSWLVVSCFLHTPQLSVTDHTVSSMHVESVDNHLQPAVVHALMSPAPAVHRGPWSSVLPTPGTYVQPLPSHLVARLRSVKAEYVHPVMASHAVAVQSASPVTALHEAPVQLPAASGVLHGDGSCALAMHFGAWPGLPRQSGIKEIVDAPTVLKSL
jgi:hypothetical protein